MRPNGIPHRIPAGFTLLEMSIVLLIVAAVTAGGMTIFVASLQKTQMQVTNARLDRIEKALQDYVNAKGYLPCPGDITAAYGAASYGVGTGTDATACTPGCTAANFTSGNTVAGGVPILSLSLPDENAVDGWGNRILYVVDQQLTAASAIGANYGVNSSPVPGSITIKDASGNVKTSAAAYALVSHGPDGHGAFPRNGGAARVNKGVTNTDSLKNCHCDNTATATAFDSIFVQKDPTLNSATATDVFDDVVRYGMISKLTTAAGLASACPCNLPWGGTINNGNSVTAYLAATVYSPATCTSQSRTCTAPTLSGSYTNQACSVLSTNTLSIWVADNSNSRLEKFNSIGTYVSKSAPGGCCANGQLYYPNGIASDSGGNVWVADYNNNRVQEFNSSGTFLLGIGAGYNGVSGSIGSGGTGNGQFGYPADVAIDAGGNIWVVDMGNHRLEKFNSSGTYVSQFGSLGSGNGQFNTPRGIAIDAGGNLWVADTNNQRVQKFNSSGVFQMGIGAGYNGVSGSIGDAGSGNGQLNSPIGIAIDAGGNIWVVEKGNSRVQEFNSSGTYVSKFGSFGSDYGQFAWPWYIAIDSGGNLWVTDQTDRAQMFDTSGIYMWQIGAGAGNGDGQFDIPEGIAFTGVCTSSATATYIGADTATQGSWVSAYGGDGYAIEADSTSYPGYATVSFTGPTTYTWAASTGDVRGLQKSANHADRLAATWYTGAGGSTKVGASYYINVNITGSAKVSLYALDWDGGNARSQRIDVMDASCLTVLDSRTVSSFSNGKYLSWTISGSVIFHVANLDNGQNAVLSGIFFDNHTP